MPSGLQATRTIFAGSLLGSFGFLLLDTRIHCVNQVSERKQRDSQDCGQQIEIMANAVLRSPTHARKNTKSFKHVSENHGDQSSCANELQKRGHAPPSYKKMIVAPVNSAHTGISATNALTAASFIASPARQQIHDPVTEIEPIHAIMFIVTSSGAVLALRWRP